MSKLKSSKGETLVETLFGMLIVSLCFIILAGGIASAAKVNKAAREQNVTFDVSTKKILDGNNAFTVRITYKGTTKNVSNLKCYQTGKRIGDEINYDEGYFYYEKNQGTP